MVKLKERVTPWFERGRSNRLRYLPRMEPASVGRCAINKPKTALALMHTPGLSARSTSAPLTCLSQMRNRQSMAAPATDKVLSDRPCHPVVFYHSPLHGGAVVLFL